MHFCLVEDNTKKEEKKEKEEGNNEVLKPDINKGKLNSNKDINHDDLNGEKDEEINNMHKACSAKCVACIIF